MNDLNKRTPKKPDIPEEIQARWQRIVDLMARILNVTAAAITKADPPQLDSPHWPVERPVFTGVAPGLHPPSQFSW